MPAIIVIGDKTSHGGEVIACSASTDTHAKRFARVGDMVSCRKCRGVFPIIEGDPSFIDEGKPIAYHGCKVACGAILISSQMVTTTTPSGGAGAGGSSGQGAESQALGNGFGHIGAGLIAAYQEEPLTRDGTPGVEGQDQRYQGRFQVLNLDTDEPVSHQEVRLRSTGGQYLTGSTDADGYTQWVQRAADEMLAFDLIGQHNASSDS